MEWKLIIWTLVKLIKRHKTLYLSCRVKTNISRDIFVDLFYFAAYLKNGIHSRSAVSRTRATAGMDESSYQEEMMLGNSTWAYSYYPQNNTQFPPLLPDKTSTSKPPACEQVHIAIEVCCTEHQNVYFCQFWTFNFFSKHCIVLCCTQLSYVLPHLINCWLLLHCSIVTLTNTLLQF